MIDVVETLRASYESRATPVVDANAVVARAMTTGARVRRRRRGAAVGSFVVVVALVATAVVAVTRPAHGVRVGTRPTPSTLPLATVAEFPDLSGIQKTAISAIAHDAADPGLARAEVVMTTEGALATFGPLVSSRTSDDLAVDVLQIRGTTFTCVSDCFGHTARSPRGTAELFVWTADFEVVTTAVRAQPLDLSTLGPVFRVPLPPIDKTPATVKPEPCTQADLDGPGIAMPAPERATTTSLPQFSRLDPAPGVTPRVSAATAWQTLTRGLPQPARRGRLLLGYYSSFIGAKGPQARVLVWVLEEQHLAYDGFEGGAALSGTPSTQPPPCEFTNAYLVLNATTGTGIVDTYGG